MEPLAAGDPVRVSDFVLHARLGTGGMGRVFLGHSPGGRAVAVKVVHPHLAEQAEFRHRFRREVTAARAVSGAFTAPVVAAGPDDDPPWIATVYVPGPTLTEAVTRAGRVAEDSVWPLAAGLTEALLAIHAEGLLHRDLKPSNVMLAADGPRVIDFGIARTMDATVLTRTGTAIGTSGFMAPEQAEGGQVGPASDVFSLGAVLAFAATGAEPFGQGAPLAVMHRVVSGEPRLDGLHRPVRALVSACLAKNPADRPTAAQLLHRITSHWSPPRDTPLWPHDMATLIDTHAMPATRRYTEPTASTAPMTAALDREDLDRRRNFAWEVSQAGEHVEAARLYADLVVDMERVLGADHPETLNARREHAGNLGGAGEHVEAARLHAGLVVDRARVQGCDHYDTLVSRHHHAWEVARAGEHAEAAELYSGLIADSARVLGADHQDTLNARSCHAPCLGALGEHVEAARLLAEVAADRVRVLGADHYDTLITRRNCAGEVSQAGEHVEAARLYADLAVDMERVLGADHPETLNARSMADRWRA
ncbi:serine/threonine-protein kinase [Streptomyces smyrnaeus]|uniref:serine/threonine-protein kinase n=1 Tax=Streptomyces smyrnaeus TaxID=1387713 RepID=UPI0033FFE06E